MMKNVYISFIVFLLVLGQTYGQENNTVTAEDYQRASNALWRNASTFIDNNIRPQWLEDGRLWYRSLHATGSTFKLYDPSKKEWLTADSQEELFEKANTQNQRKKIQLLD